MAAESMNPNALTVPQLARLLSKAGGEPVTEEMLQADVGAGTRRTPTVQLTWCTMLLGC